MGTTTRALLSNVVSPIVKPNQTTSNEDATTSYSSRICVCVCMWTIDLVPPWQDSRRLGKAILARRPDQRTVPVAVVTGTIAAATSPKVPAVVGLATRTPTAAAEGGHEGEREAERLHPPQLRKRENKIQTSGGSLSTIIFREGSGILCQPSRGGRRSRRRARQHVSMYACL